MFGAARKVAAGSQVVKKRSSTASRAAGSRRRNSGSKVPRRASDETPTQRSAADSDTARYCPRSSPAPEVRSKIHSSGEPTAAPNSCGKMRRSQTVCRFTIGEVPSATSAAGSSPACSGRSFAASSCGAASTIASNAVRSPLIQSALAAPFAASSMRCTRARFHTDAPTFSSARSAGSACTCWSGTAA